MPIVNQEGHVVGPDFKDHLGSFKFALRPIAESRIEEAGIVGAQFSTRRLISDHFCGVAGGYPDTLLRRENVELFRF